MIGGHTFRAATRTVPLAGAGVSEKSVVKAWVRNVPLCSGHLARSKAPDEAVTQPKRETVARSVPDRGITGHQGARLNRIYLDASASVGAFVFLRPSESLSPSICLWQTGALLVNGPPYPPCPLSNAGPFIRSMVRHP
jgi:hypothetical protein